MHYIINFDPFIPSDIDYEKLTQIEFLIKNKKSITQDDARFFLDHICYQVRNKVSPDMQDFHNKCDLVQSILYYYFQELGCSQVANTTQNAITSNIVGHNFLILELLVDNQKILYLVDPTYIQFFESKDCTKQNFFVSSKYPDYILLTPNPGYFIKDEQKDMAKFLINHGYINLEKDTSRMYGDSFLNTKKGISLKNWQYQTINGQTYLNSFIKNNYPLSKTKEELLKEDMLLLPCESYRNK